MKLTPETVRKNTSRYYDSLKRYTNLKATTESTTEQAFKRLLDDLGHSLNLTLIKVSESVTAKSRIIPDGIIVNEFNRRMGYWEAKDTKDDLKDEILKKIDKGYPLKNTIFEDTKTAILYQDGLKVLQIKMQDEADLTKLLVQFFNYSEPIVEEFRAAIRQFQADIPGVAAGLAELITKEKTQNPDFKAAVTTFLDVCSASFHADVSDNDIEDMLIQHLLTERIFRRVFDNPEFVSRNVIAVQLEKLVSVLTQKSFNRGAFFKSIDFFYQAIENQAAQIEDFSEKQGFLNTIYEIFFQSYSKKNADKNGIVYTPQPLVRFMVRFTDRLLKAEFGLSLSDKGVNIIDPCTGTGNFVMEILRNISPEALPHKYKKEIFCNEIMLLPYYIASVNIEYYYYQTTGQYKSFDNIVFTDTLELIEDKRQQKGQQGMLDLGMVMNEANTERAKRQLNSPLFVIIGNPPYDAVGNETQNRAYKIKRNEVIHNLVEQTYAKASKATLKRSLYDPYVKFFRWATNRLNRENGIVCFVTNNSFMNGICFDGMRQLLLQDYHHIYHFDLGGDVKDNPKLSGSKHNVFGIQEGVGITFLVRHSKLTDHQLFYHSLDTFLTKEEKYEILENLIETCPKIIDIDWKKGDLDSNRSYVFDDESREKSTEYNTFVPLYTDDHKGIFHEKYPGINTARTEWVFDFTKEGLTEKLNTTIDFYNQEIERLETHIKNTKGFDRKQFNLDNFVERDDSKIKWSRDLLQRKLSNCKTAIFDKTKIVEALPRPFIKKYLYYDSIFIDSPSKYGDLQKVDNQFICINGLGQQKAFSCLLTNLYPEFQTVFNCQTFPLVYVEKVKLTTSDGDKIEYRPKSNITAFGRQVFGGTDEAIFYYVYGILHHAGFRAKFENLLKTTAPRVPVVKEHFEAISDIGRSLAELHLHFEQAERRTLCPDEATEKRLDNDNTIPDWSIDKMRIKDNILRYNAQRSYILPPQAFGYEVNGRTPVEWIVDQYRDIDPEDDSVLALIERCITTISQSKTLIDQLYALCPTW